MSLDSDIHSRWVCWSWPFAFLVSIGRSCIFDLVDALLLCALQSIGDFAQLLLDHWLSSQRHSISFRPCIVPIRLSSFNNLPLISSTATLINAKADINATNKDGESALHYAAEVGSLDIVKCLIAHKANVNNLTKERHLPLHFAVAYRHPSIVELLLNSHSVMPKSVLEIETSKEIDDRLEAYTMGVKYDPKKSGGGLSIDTDQEEKESIKSFTLPSVLQTPVTPTLLKNQPNPFGDGK